MISDLFNTTVTITPSVYSHSNRSAQVRTEPDNKKENIPALVTIEDIAYIEIEEGLIIKVGYVILDEKTLKEYTVSDFHPMGDAYKILLKDKNV
jgi:hypothetical protein